VDGISNFSALQAALGDRDNVPGRKAAHEAVFYAFDLLNLNGVDLMPAPCLSVRTGLWRSSAPGAIRYSEHLPADEGDAQPYACIRADRIRSICAMDRVFATGKRESTGTHRVILRSSIAASARPNS
jgi:hypothetical protein